VIEFFTSVVLDTEKESDDILGKVSLMDHFLDERQKNYQSEWLEHERQLEFWNIGNHSIRNPMSIVMPPMKSV
jgi:hypothetical protein